MTVLRKEIHRRVDRVRRNGEDGRGLSQQLSLQDHVANHGGSQHHDDPHDRCPVKLLLLEPLARGLGAMESRLASRSGGRDRSWAATVIESIYFRLGYLRWRS